MFERIHLKWRYVIKINHVLKKMMISYKRKSSYMYCTILQKTLTGLNIVNNINVVLWQQGFYVVSKADSGDSRVWKWHNAYTTLDSVGPVRQNNYNAYELCMNET